MASAIERFLYGEAADLVSADGQVGDFFVAEMRLGEKLIELRLASERQPYTFRWFRFREACLNGFSDAAREPDDLCLPWYILGFYSWECPNGFWKFNLTCSRSRWSWNSRWPEVENAD